MVKTLDRKVIRDLKTLRSQTVTLAILVACGVSLLVSSWSSFRSLQTARDTYYRTNVFADIFADLKRAPDDLASRLRKIPGVQTLDTRIVADGLVESSDQTEPAIGRFATLPGNSPNSLNRIHLRSGRLPVDRTEPPEVLVHEGYANAHSIQPGSWIEVVIEGQRQGFRVAGIGISPEYVYALNPVAFLPDNKRFGIFWLTPSTLERLTGMSGAFNSIAIKLEPHASADEVKRSADQILAPYGSLGAYGRDRQISSMFVEDEIAQQKVSAIFYPLVFLAVAAFLIHVIIGRLVFAQRSQIATLKALGYSNLEVSTHYAKLVSVMLVIGALTGIMLGTVFGRLISLSYQNFFRFPRLDLSLSLSAIAVGIAAGMIPGLLGAFGSIRSSYKLPPAEAMRPEAPKVFHRTLLEQAGLLNRLTTRGRMIARNLTLRPWRLAMTSFGISLALAIVVLAGFWHDTLTFVLDTQFNRLQREDLGIIFRRPLPSSALQDLRRLDGVLAIEGYRTVPIRIRHLNFERETSLYGWPRDASMRQRLDTDLSRIEIPPDGLLLSRFFSKALSIHVGDRVEIEILEGERRTLSLRVTGFSDDLIGYSAAMDIRSLWREIDEAPVFNLAALRVEPRSLSQVYVSLQGMPEVASISIKSAMLHGFNSTIGTLIRISSTVLTTFALSIGVGVIYNSVRVSFAERSWELASLRVLGFRSNEVFRLLIAEVATLVALSIVPGCAVGWCLAWLFTKTMHTETFTMPVIITLATFSQAVLALVFALFVSGFVVSRLLRSLVLADALKARD